MAQKLIFYFTHFSKSYFGSVAKVNIFNLNFLIPWQTFGENTVSSKQIRRYLHSKLFWYKY